MSEVQIGGIHHLALNVRDLEKSVAWYADVLGFVALFPYDTDDFQRRLMRHPSGAVLGLTKHHHPDAEADFSERRTGLDHVAFAVGSLPELEAWAARLDAAGIAHSGVTITPQTRSALISFRDPDNIALELYVTHSAAAG